MGVLNKVQKEHKPWAAKNFGDTGTHIKVSGTATLVMMIAMMGNLCRSHLKASQGIRGTEAEHVQKAEEALRHMRLLMDDYVNRRVWKMVEDPDGDMPGTAAVFGAMEEVGELANSHRENDVVGSQDAIGDIIIYLADYCNRRGLDLEEIVSDTWMHVKQRDWTKNKKDGKVEPCDGL